jgi:hypothetical protein
MTLVRGRGASGERLHRAHGVPHDLAEVEDLGPETHIRPPSPRKGEGVGG